MLYEASPAEAGAEDIELPCGSSTPSWQGHRNLTDRRGSGQRKVLVEDTATSSDHNPFSRTTLGNSLLRSQQAKLPYSKFGPCYANPCKLVPLPQFPNCLHDNGWGAAAEGTKGSIQLQLWEAQLGSRCMAAALTAHPFLCLCTRDLHYFCLQGELSII